MIAEMLLRHKDTVAGPQTNPCEGIYPDHRAYSSLYFSNHTVTEVSMTVERGVLVPSRG